MNKPEMDPYPYLDAALALHGLELDAARKEEVARQFKLLVGMAQLVEDMPLGADVEPANIFRP